MKRLLQAISKGKPAAAGEAYGAPGAGSAPLTSIISVVLILGSWFLVTQPIWNNGLVESAATIAEQAESVGRDNETLQRRVQDIIVAAEALRSTYAGLEHASTDVLSAGMDDLSDKVESLAGAVRYASEDAKTAGTTAAQETLNQSQAQVREMQKKINDIREVERTGGQLRLDIALIKPLFVPSPQAVIHRFLSLFSEDFSGGTLQHHIWESCRRVFLAFLLAILTAVPLGVLMGINRQMRGFFDPIIEFYRPIPPLAYLPLVIVWFGIGEEPKVLLIYLAIFAPVVINSRAGVRSVAIEQIHAAYSMGATKTQVIWHVILKGALPEILTGMRIGIAFGWTTLVAAELAAAQAGLGAMIKSASDFLVTDVIFVGILVIAAIAYLFDMGMRWVDKVAVPWKGRI